MLTTPVTLLDKYNEIGLISKYNSFLESHPRIHTIESLRQARYVKKFVAISYIPSTIGTIFLIHILWTGLYI